MRERLRVDALPEHERRAYYRDMEALRYQKSVIETGRIKGRAEGRAEGFVEGEKRKQQGIVGKMKSSGIALEMIIQITGLSREETEQL